MNDSGMDLNQYKGPCPLMTFLKTIWYLKGIRLADKSMAHGPIT